MSVRDACSVAPWAAALLDGAPVVGVGLGHGYVDLGARGVLAVTPPGAPRMPNGIESDAFVDIGERVSIGGGALSSRRVTVVGGPTWDPVPVVRAWPTLRSDASFDVDPDELVGWGPGLTPLGDDLLVGHLAGLALLGVAAPVWPDLNVRTTGLAATLLQLATAGALPEAAHALVRTGDLRPLLAFGASSGRAIALGLALAHAADDDAPVVGELTLDLPGGRRTFTIGVTPARTPPTSAPSVARRGQSMAYGCSSWYP